MFEAFVLLGRVKQVQKHQNHKGQAKKHKRQQTTTRVSSECRVFYHVEQQSHYYEQHLYH